MKIGETIIAGFRAGKPKCDMKDECKDEVSMIDKRGFAYCEKHGKQRAMSEPCRKLRPKELELIKSGKPVEEY